MQQMNTARLSTGLIERGLNQTRTTVMYYNSTTICYNNTVPGPLTLASHANSWRRSCPSTRTRTRTQNLIVLCICLRHPLHVHAPHLASAAFAPLTPDALVAVSNCMRYHINPYHRRLMSACRAVACWTHTHTQYTPIPPNTMP